MGSAVPAPPDPTAGLVAQATQSAMASMHRSDNMTHLGMAQISAGIIQSFQGFLLGSQAIAATKQQVSDAVDAKVEIAKLNFKLARQENDNRHTEKLDELRTRRMEIRVASRPQVDTTNFLANS